MNAIQPGVQYSGYLRSLLFEVTRFPKIARAWPAGAPNRGVTGKRGLQRLFTAVVWQGSRFGVEQVRSDENARVVNQRGLFIKIPQAHSLEEVVSTIYRGEEHLIPLMKIRIPNQDRTTCLRSLNRMNINHLSLFPDLYGASYYTNTDLHIKD